MSEPTAPYSPRRPLHLRYVFEHMETGERHTREVTLEEVEHPHFWKGLDNYEVVGRYLSTGLTDAEGREVWEGDLLVGRADLAGDDDNSPCVVRFGRHEGLDECRLGGVGFWLDGDGWGYVMPPFLDGWRVVGNIYETAPEPAS